MTSPVTLAPLINGPPAVTAEPSACNTTSPKVTLSPAAASIFSTAIVSPGLTLYCLPPERIIAYAMIKFLIGKAGILPQRPNADKWFFKEFAWSGFLGLRKTPKIIPAPLNTREREGDPRAHATPLLCDQTASMQCERLRSTAV